MTLTASIIPSKEVLFAKRSSKVRSSRRERCTCSSFTIFQPSNVCGQKWTYRKGTSGHLLICRLATVLDIVLNVVKEPSNGRLVVVVFLAL